ncbi:MAG: type II toxin-antitoxin system Phd/YefM family antitoxin [Gammaproteobacteria bacterium]|nr:type II toxin-antitoxin system Phd/YefM family antitoxin [Gammaproteobacteria bacterium]
MRAWNIQDAKNRFCQIIKDTENAPQDICKNGKSVAVIISRKEYNELLDKNLKSHDEVNVVDFFRNSPLIGLELDIDRSDITYRDIDL